MKAWTSAEIAGRCAYDGTHTWQPGARIFRVQGQTWKKLYCAHCATARHGAPEDTGEFVDLESHPSYPTPLKALAESVAGKVLPFDAKAAAANDRADEPEALFAEPFEEAR